MVVLPVDAIVFPLSIAVRQITVNLTRDGEQTLNPKVVMLLSPVSLAIGAFFVLNNGVDGSQSFLASAVDTDWFLIAADTVLPRRTAMRYPTISEDTTFSLDLSDGSSSGGGLPAFMSARVAVSGVPAARELLAVEQKPDGEWRVAGSARASPAGEAALDLQVTGAGRIYALALDDWGVVYQSNLDVAEGAVVRPAVFIGWLYRITEAGTLPATEPEWWPAEGDNASRLLGTARAIAVRYYQPLAHGPLPVELL